MHIAPCVLFALLVLWGVPAAAEDEAAVFEARVRALETRLQAANKARDRETALEVRKEYAALVEATWGGDDPRLAGALNALANAWRDRGRMDLGIPVLERALAVNEKALGAEHPDSVATLNNLGMALHHVGRNEDARRTLEKALAIRERLLGATHAATMVTSGNLGAVYRSLGRHDLALPMFARVLAHFEAARGTNDPLTATALNNLAASHESLGHYDEALPLYERALAISEATLGGAHIETAGRLNNLAVLHSKMGFNDKAVPLLERVRAISESSLGPDHPTTAMAWNNLAEAYKISGRYGDALPLYRKAVELIERTAPAHPYAIPATNNLAGILVALGRYDEALVLLEKTLAANERQRGSEHRDTAQALNNLAHVLRHKKQIDKAAALLERSLAILQKSLGEAHPETAIVTGNLGGLYALLGRHADAESMLGRSLAIREQTLGGEHPEVAMALANLADFYRQSGRPAEALPRLHRAWRLAAASGIPELLREAEGQLRKTHAALHQNDLAIFHGKRAVNVMQGLRERSRSLPGELQQGFVQAHAGHYRALADLLVAAGRLAEAQQVLAMLKEDEFFEFIRRDAAADRRVTALAWTPAEAPLAADLEQRLAETAALAEELRRIESALRADPAAAGKERAGELRTGLLALARQSDALFARLAVELPQANRRLAEAGRRHDAGLTARARQGLAAAGRDTALLHYLLLGDRIRILLTTSDLLLARDVPVVDAELHAGMLEFRQQSEDPGGNPKPAAEALYRLLVAPVAADLDAAGIRTLRLVLDGALRYLPFAALHDGRGYLVERYAVVLDTPAAPRQADRPGSARLHLAGFGVTRAIGDLSALPDVGEEIRGIVAVQGVRGDARLDADFTLSALRGALGRDYSLLHIASHFLFTPGNESESFLLLGDGTRLSLRELRVGGYRFDSLDLLTLSACSTAMSGGREADGREVEGFGALAQYQGARNVLATLWPIADRSTARLMQSFYRHRAGGAGVAEALQKAQIELLKGGAGKPPDNFTHPFFWAPFIVMGRG